MSYVVLYLLDFHWGGARKIYFYYTQATTRSQPFQGELLEDDTAKMVPANLAEVRCEVAHRSVTGSTTAEILRAIHNSMQTNQPVSNDTNIVYRFIHSVNLILDGFKAYFDRLAPIEKHYEFESFWAEIMQARMLDGAAMAQAIQKLLKEGVSRKSGCAAAQQFVRIGCTFVAQAQKRFLKLKDFGGGWFSLSQAHYCLGLLAGREFGIEEKGQGNVASAARKLQDARHAETRSMRAEAIAWYIEHRESFRSNQEAAEAIAKIVPAKVRTIVSWIAAHNKTKK